MDWNSFFSAISQASAALLGIVLAFLISKILSEVTDYDSIERDTTKLLLESTEVRALASDLAFYWHDRMIIKYDSDIEELITSGELTGKSNEQIADFLKEKTRLYFPFDVIDLLNEKIEFDSSKNILRAVAFPTNLWTDINKFEDEVGTLELRANVLIKKLVIQQHTIDKNIQDLTRLSNILLAFLPIIWLTVIYPLHFLPLRENDIPSISFSVPNMIAILLSIKGFFLSCLTLSTVGIILYFCYVCHSHINGYKKIRAEIKADDMDVTKYCKAFTLRQM